MSSDDIIIEILAESKIVAVVGLSRDSEKDSNRVARYLQSKGYRVIPVNPAAKEILGEKSYRSLLNIPEEMQRSLDVVDIFRSSQDVPPIVDEAVYLRRRFGHPQVVWMQLGIVNDEAAETAGEAGLTVVMNRCMMMEHKRLFTK